jgi:nucleoside-diphosphate-sugar epimerase
MTVLVTGAAGFLGCHLTQALCDRGERVRALVRPGEDITRLRRANVQICEGDLRDTASVERAVDGADCVLHCAARTGPWGPPADYYRVNVVGTESLLTASLLAGVRRFVHVSSITVHGADIHGAGDESLPLVPGPDPYTQTKVAAERIVQRVIEQGDAPVTIVRPGLIYGPGDTTTFARLTRLIQRGRMPVIGSGHNHLPLIYVTDVAQGIFLASEAAPAVGRTYLLVNDEPVTQVDLLATIARELAVPPPRFRVPYRPALALAAVAEALCRATGSRQPPPLTRFGLRQLGGENRFLIDRARSQLGFSPLVDVSVGVHNSLAWFRAREDPAMA